jgi:hypothetical protein
MNDKELDIFERLDPSIIRGLGYLSEANERNFRKAIRDQAEDSQLLLHTTRELHVGVYMIRQGYGADFARPMGNQTPDWYFIGREGRPDLFAEVVNFHLTPKLEREIEETCKTKGGWFGYLPNNEDRMHGPLWEKAGKYSSLAKDTGLPFVIFVYGLFNAFVHEREVEACLYPEETGLFHQYPTLTGVCFFQAGGIPFRQDGFRFIYFPNELSNHPEFRIESGTLPMPLPQADGRSP